jgi:hypothetical protein
MKNSKLAVLIVTLSITPFWNLACAQNEPTSARPLPATPNAPAVPAQKTAHEQATTEAWAAFRAGDNQTAIAKADQCIIPYRDAADSSQATLEADKVTLPKGKTSEADKKRIAQHQILHDVAICCLIKGWAEEKLGRTNEARKAYTQAQKYTQARSAMSNGESFWSPAESASERLAKM